MSNFAGSFIGGAPPPTFTALVRVAVPLVYDKREGPESACNACSLSMQFVCLREGISQQLRCPITRAPAALIDAPPPPVRDAIPDREAFAACVVATRNFRAYPMLVSSPSPAGTTLYPRFVE